VTGERLVTPFFLHEFSHLKKQQIRTAEESRTAVQSRRKTGIWNASRRPKMHPSMILSGISSPPFSETDTLDP
jgi:hypothetical protein